MATSADAVTSAMDLYREERARWVQLYGSERLKLAERLGLLDASDKVYREERLAIERPGWRWRDERDVVKEILNPSMGALEAFEHHRGNDTHAKLVYLIVRTSIVGGMIVRKGPAILSWFNRREIVLEIVDEGEKTKR